MITLVWLRQDLRLADNPALYAACRNSSQVILVFIDDPSPTSTSQLGAASRVWLQHSLQTFQRSLIPFKQQLIIRQGQALSVLQALIRETGAQQVLWNRVYEPICLARDTQIKQALQAQCMQAMKRSLDALSDRFDRRSNEESQARMSGYDYGKRRGDGDV